MTDLATALHDFFASFGLEDYAESMVPEDAQLPYITHRLVRPSWDAPASLTARLWYKATSLTAMCDKADAIARRIGEGLKIPLQHGYAVLYKDSTFAQMMPSDEASVNSMHLSMILKVFATWGGN